MRGVKHKSHEELTLLELVLQLHGEFRRSLEPIGVIPLQADVLLYVRRHTETNMTNAAAALCLRLSRQKITERIRDIRSNLMFEKET